MISSKILHLRDKKVPDTSYYFQQTAIKTNGVLHSNFALRNSCQSKLFAVVTYVQESVCSIPFKVRKFLELELIRQMPFESLHDSHEMPFCINKKM